MGGAAGHMKHPFDLPAVETGEDLKEFFETAADWVIENTAALKIDGVNASFKLIDSPDAVNGKEFALDRGSAKPIDIEGITTNRVGERWPEEHGMHAATIILLGIFNKALWHDAGAHITEELQQLGLWDDPTKIFNAEFVLKSLNVKEYKTNFIALHGINKFDWATKRRRASKEISYDKDVLESIRDKVAPFAKAAKDLKRNNLDMEVYTSVPAKVLRDDGGTPIRADFSNTLNSAFLIHQRYGEPPVKRSLGNWLSGADNPRDAKIPLVTGRKVGALSKEIYKIVLNTTEPLADLLGDDEEYIKLARDGAIFWHATRLLGHDVLSTLTAGEDFGPVNDEEGIVLRDKIAFGTDDPVKITGNFILGGEEGKLAKKARPPSKEPDKAGIIALFPGGFKPPHAGHFELAKRYAEDPQVSKVLMLLGPAVRTSTDGSVKITKESSIHIISEFYKQYLGDKIVIEDSPAGEENPMRAAFKWIEEGAQTGETYTLAASSKDADRAEQFTNSHQCPDGKYCKPGVNVVLHPVDTQALIYSGRTDGLNGKPISASVMREDLANGDEENFKTNLPAEAADYVDEIFDFLGGVKKTEEPPSPSSSDEEPIEEISSMAGGTVEGAPSAGGAPWSSFSEEENDLERRRSKLKENKQESETNYKHMSRRENKHMKEKQVLKEEETLRKHIRSSLRKKYFNYFNEEKKLRKYIKKLILEAKDVAYTNSTGANRLIPVLDTVVPQVLTTYKSLRTAPEQRASYRRHYIKALEMFLDFLEVRTFGPEEDIEMEPESLEAAPAEEVLQEQEGAPMPDAGGDTPGPDSRSSEEKEVDIKIKTEIEKEEKAAKVKADDEMIKTEEGDETAPFPTLPEEDLTGRENALEAFKKTKTTFQAAFVKLFNKDDRVDFKNWGIVNMGRHLDEAERQIGGAKIQDDTTEQYERLLGLMTPDAAAPEVASTAEAAPPETDADAPTALEEIINNTVAKLISEFTT